MGKGYFTGSLAHQASTLEQESVDEIDKVPERFRVTQQLPWFVFPGGAYLVADVAEQAIERDSHR